MSRIDLPFSHTYAQLPERFYQKVLPAKAPQPQLLIFNKDLAEDLALSFANNSSAELAEYFSGQKIFASANPLAMAYAGHQFGHFVPQLGDGRAILLGELTNRKGQRFDLQLKGAGRTAFSRGGDGKAALGPVLREYLVSEAMFHLGVPTTRSLAAVLSGESVQREESLPGAILTRVASSHLRVGHFEYFAARGDRDGLKELVEFAIHRHTPEIAESKSPLLEFFKSVVAAQARLIAQWMDIGFIHGVMNTDNMLISGETIDYGPCAFMDKFNFDQVFSSIDRHGRYAFNQQPIIAQWNLARLAECLCLLERDNFDPKPFEDALVNFEAQYKENWLNRMRKKLGLATSEPDDADLVQSWLEELHRRQLDYTSSYRTLAKSLLSPNVKIFEDSAPQTDFEIKWRERLRRQNIELTTVAQQMNLHNPIYIPRNHLIEKAIQAALNGDMSIFHELNRVLSQPFEEKSDLEIYARPPRPDERVTKTFCGT
jgi:uncharacterized protein YdiU (UPF0061 family)